MITAFKSWLVMHPTCSFPSDFNCSVFQPDVTSFLCSSKNLLYHNYNPNKNQYHNHKEKKKLCNCYTLARLTTSSTSGGEKKRTSKDASFQSTEVVGSVTKLSSPSSIGKEQTLLSEQGKHSNSVSPSLKFLLCRCLKFLLCV